MVTIEDSRTEAQTVQIAHHPLQTVYSEVHWMKFNAYFQQKGFVPEEQPVMCDFNVVKDDQDPNKFFISLLLEMEDSRNSGAVLAFAMATLTQFEYRPRTKPTPLPENEEERWDLYYSALSASIGIARGHLVTYLAPTIYRGYLLPLLDVQQLLNRKYTRTKLPAVPSTAPSEKPTPRAKKGEK